MVTSNCNPDEGHPQRYIIALTVMLASVIELIDSSIVVVALPDMMGNLGANLDQINWVSTSYMIANVIIIPITGWLSELFGRRRYIMASIAIFTFASMMCGFSRSLNMLIFWRAIQGLGGGGLLATSQAVLFQVFPKKEHTRAMALFGMGVVMGPSFGPVIGGYLITKYAWPWIFYVNLPVGVIAFLMSWSYVPEVLNRRKPEKIDFGGLALLAIGISTLQTLLDRGQRLGWLQSAEIRVLILVSVATLGLLIWWELRCRNPVIDFRVLANSQFAACAVFIGIIGVVMYGVVFILPVYLQELLGFTALKSGMILVPGALCAGLSMAMLSRIGDRISGRVLIGVSTLVFAAIMLSVFTRFTLQSMPIQPLVGNCYRGFFLGLLFVPLSSWAVAALPAASIPSATGLFNVCRQLGGSIGIAWVSSYVTRHTKIFYVRLAEDVRMGRYPATDHLHTVTEWFWRQGSPLALAREQGIMRLALDTQQQAVMMSYQHLFAVLGLLMLAGLFCLPFLRTSPGGKSNRGRAGSLLSTTTSARRCGPIVSR